VGGEFGNLGGTAASLVAAVDPTSGAAIWRGNLVGSAVYAIAPDGARLWLGGGFDHVGPTARSDLAALDPASGALDTSFNVGADFPVDTIAVDGGRLYLGGEFDHLGGLTLSGLAAIDTGPGSVVPWTAHTSDEVNSVVSSLSGLYAGGGLSQLGGAPARGIGVVDPGTGVATSWTPNIPVPSSANAVAIGGAKLFMGGNIQTDHDLQVNFRVFDFSPPANTAPPSVTGGGARADCAPGAWTTGIVQFAYRWQRDGAAVAGAADSSLPLTAADVGHSFSCTVTGTNEAGSAEASSAPFLLTPSTTGPPVKDAKAPKMRISRLVRSGRALKLTLSCPADEQSCSGTVTVSALVAASAKTKKIKLGSARFTIAGGKRKAVKIKLSRKALKLVRAKRRISVTVKARDAAGNLGTASAKLRLPAARHRR
jgi:hypothetical protein